MRLLAVLAEKSPQPADGLLKVFRMGQKDHAEMIGPRPIECRALHDEELFPAQEVEGEALVIGDVEALRIKPCKQIEGPLRLDATDAVDVGQEPPGQLPLLIQATARPYTAPVGLLGLMITSARVRRVTLAARSSRSGAQSLASSHR